MLEWIAKMITYLLTGINGFESMNLWEFIYWFPKYQLIETIVTGVFCVIVSSVCIIIMIEILDRLEEERA